MMEDEETRRLWTRGGHSEGEGSPSVRSLESTDFSSTSFDRAAAGTFFSPVCVQTRAENVPFDFPFLSSSTSLTNDSSMSSSSNKKINSGDMLFHCFVCDRWMPTYSKESHVKGKAHTKKKKMAAFRTRKEDDPVGGESSCKLCSGHHCDCEGEVMRDDDDKDDGVLGFHCDVCDKDMHVNFKESHLKGKAHLKRARHATTSCQNASNITTPYSAHLLRLSNAEKGGEREDNEKSKGTKPLTSSLRRPSGCVPWSSSGATLLPRKSGVSNRSGMPVGLPLNASQVSERNEELYLCVTCDRWMPLHSKTSHEQGLQHFKKSRSAVTDDVFECDVCDRVMPAYSKDSHIQGKQHAKNLRKFVIGESSMFYCELCDRNVPEHAKDNHLRGKLHVRRTLQGASVTDRNRTSKLVSSVSTSFADEMNANVARVTTTSDGVTRDGVASSRTQSHDMYECDVCDRKMPSFSRSSHVQGKEHKRKENRIRRSLEEVAKATVLSVLPGDVDCE